MARNRPRGAKRGGAEARPTKATSRKKAAAPVAEVEVIEEGGGSTFDDAVVIVTTLLLLTAILFVDYELGTHYGTGLFFK